MTRDYSLLEKPATTRHRDDHRDRPPIDDMLLALHLLGRGDRVRGKLMVKKHEQCTHYIEVMTFNGGYTRDLHSGSEYYPVTEKLAWDLVALGLVRGTPQWGYTDDTELTLSTHAWETYERQKQDFTAEVLKYCDTLPEKPMLVESCYRVNSMRFLRDFDDFYVSLVLNENRDEVRRTRGNLAFVRRQPIASP